MGSKCFTNPGECWLKIPLITDITFPTTLLSDISYCLYWRALLRLGGKVCGAFLPDRWRAGFMGEKQTCCHLQRFSYSVVTANDTFSFSFPELHSTKQKLKPKPAIFIFEQFFLSNINSFPTLTQHRNEHLEASVPLVQLCIWCVYLQWIYAAGWQTDAFASHITDRAPVSRYQ